MTMAERMTTGQTEPVCAEDISSASESEESLSLGLRTSESVQSVTSSVSSLLDRLRSPAPSVLTRKRLLKQNPPPKGVKRGKGKDKGDPKNITASERVKSSYPDEEFSVSNTKLFCRARREELATKKSSIESHIKSQKHERKKETGRKEQRKADIVQALKAYDSEVHPVGDGLPFSTRVYRVKVVSTMLKVGVPLEKIDLFRSLLEEHAYSLTSSTHLRQLIPFIIQEELSKIKKEILRRPLSIFFDGTTHVCEAFVIVLRYLTDD